MGEEARFVARYASTYVRGESFGEVGDVLAARGFDMLRATQTERGVLVIPHKEESRQSAHLFAVLDAVEAAEKLDDPPVETNGHTTNGHQPMSLAAAEVELITAGIESGAVEVVPLTCGECGAIHSEGVVCLIPIMYESSDCCPHVMQTYAHEGPHEAWFRDPDTNQVIVTHRWIEELVITDVEFDAYSRDGAPAGRPHLTDAQLALINRDIVNLVGWDAAHRPVVEFNDESSDTRMAVHPNGRPVPPADPVRPLAGEC